MDNFLLNNCTLEALSETSDNKETEDEEKEFLAVTGDEKLHTRLLYFDLIELSAKLPI